MEIFEDLKMKDKFEWIKNHFSSEPDSWNQISDIIPDIFDKYFLVHWKAGIIDNFPLMNIQNRTKQLRKPTKE